MGMYTEFIFQGETIKDLPDSVKKWIDYFFDEKSIFDPYLVNHETPDHDFFKCQRFPLIGHMSSYYFNPFTLRHRGSYLPETNITQVFLRCDLKNYDDEIEKFLDWIRPYMYKYWGYYWYEENAQPTFFKAGRI